MAIAAQSANRLARRKPCWTGTPEIYFAKPIDNSRLVKVEDPRRSREMKQFGFTLGCLFVLVMMFAWQHFKAIESRHEYVRQHQRRLMGFYRFKAFNSVAGFNHVCTQLLPQETSHRSSKFVIIFHNDNRATVVSL